MNASKLTKARMTILHGHADRLGLYIWLHSLLPRNKNDSTFLNFAIKVADMIMDRVKTDDAIPYWDYDAPVTEETPRDGLLLLLLPLQH